MKLISLNVGLPREVEFEGNLIKTGIYKNPTEGRIALRRLNLDGDRQADLSVHGGPDKAVYSYPSEYYPFWRDQYPNIEMNWGMFGENFTTSGLFEDEVNVGDEFEIGSSKLVAVQPRMPCFKLGVKFGTVTVIRKFFASEKPGVYFRVLREGEVAAGDEIKMIKRDEHNITIKDIMKLYTTEKSNTEKIKKAVNIPALPESWRSFFVEQLESVK
jgi:MOSC domain-containing protein YiiM